jgi:UDP-N-acetylmuramate dehydrogenase
MTDKISREITSTARGIVRLNEPLAKHTTFGIGGPADIFFEPADPEDLATVISRATELGINWWVLGDGANVLVSDKGVRGIVIKLGRNFAKIKIDGNVVTAGASAKLDKLVTQTARIGLSGLECAAGIPGTVGGGIVMNAGTYHGCIGSRVESVKVIRSDGSTAELSQNEIGFRYRWSIFQSSISDIIMQAVFRLTPADPDELMKKVEEIRARRSRNLPSCGRSAGCVFKNPDETTSAGKMIEIAGMKGARIGDAIVAEEHANFILNIGNASAYDVKTLAEKVRRAVKDKFGVELEYEIRLVGEW